METGMESDVSDHLDHEEMYLMLQADMVNIILRFDFVLLAHRTQMIVRDVVITLHSLSSSVVIEINKLLHFIFFSKTTEPIKAKFSINISLDDHLQSLFFPPFKNLTWLSWPIMLSDWLK
jgi:hypothetical protein